MYLRIVVLKITRISKIPHKVAENCLDTNKTGILYHLKKQSLYKIVTHHKSNLIISQ